MSTPSRRHAALPAIATLLGLALVPAVTAAPHPFGQAIRFDGVPGGYVEIAHAAALNPTAAMTLEFWVKFLEGPGCKSLVGKNFSSSYWVGACAEFRSYLNGDSRDGGFFLIDTWQHVALTFDGSTRRHFLNGLEVLSAPFAGPLATNTNALRIGSDVSFNVIPSALVDEVRLWNVARTGAQIQAAMNGPISSPQTGLVAVWPLDGNGDDILGPHDGTLEGTVSFEGAPAPPYATWLDVPSTNFPGEFEAQVRINGATQGKKVTTCIDNALCVAGAIASQAEVFVRVVGPKSNGFLWPTLVKFNTTVTEIWIRQKDTGKINYYPLLPAGVGADTLNGLFDRTGFTP